jgi:hypothetical protein
MMVRLSSVDKYQYSKNVSKDNIEEPSCCLTINLKELKLGDIPERLFNKKEFFRFYRSDSESLFKGLF